MHRHKDLLLLVLHVKPATPGQALLLGLQAHAVQPTASAACNLPAGHGSSLLQSKDTRTVAASRLQNVPQGVEYRRMEHVKDDTADSPDLDLQVGTGSN